MKTGILCVGSIVTTIVISCAILTATSAATLKSVATKDGGTIILLSGEIVEGDTDTLKASIKTANDAGKLVSGVRLNSPGGNLLEGLKLADAVRFAKVATNVAGGATCASACFLVYAAGATKFANYTAQVGIHGASDKQGEETAASGAATVSMARAAKELGVPAAIIGRMVVRGMVEIVGHSQTKGRDNREPKLQPKPARQSSTLLMSGDGKRGDGQRPQATAPTLDSTGRYGRLLSTQPARPVSANRSARPALSRQTQSEALRPVASSPALPLRTAGSGRSDPTLGPA
jgi:ATP-dependent protease ClpP protease subunit